MWKAFAASMPSDSYSKGALSSLLVELENALRSDFLPTLSLSSAHQRAVEIVATAKAEAGRIKENSQKEAERILSSAEKEAQQTRERVERLKVRFVSEIEKI